MVLVLRCTGAMEGYLLYGSEGGEHGCPAVPGEDTRQGYHSGGQESTGTYSKKHLGARGGGVGDRPVSWWVKWLSAAVWGGGGRGQASQLVREVAECSSMGGGVGDRPVSWWVKWLSAAAGEGQWGVKCWQVIRGGVRVVVVRHLHRQHPRTLRRLVVGW